MPNGGCIKGGESGSQTPRGPIQDGYHDNVGETTKSAQEQASLSIKFLVAKVGGDGGRGGSGGGAWSWVEPHHVRQLSVESERWVVELVAILALTKGGNWFEIIPKCLPLGQMKLGAGVVALGTYALEAGTIFAVVEGSVDQNFRLRAACVGA